MERHLVEGVILHHAGDGTALAHFLTVFEVFQRVQAAGDEVVAQPQNMPHLVHGYRADIGFDELVFADARAAAQGRQQTRHKIPLPCAMERVLHHRADARVVQQVGIAFALFCFTERRQRVNPIQELGAGDSRHVAVDGDARVQNLPRERVSAEERNRVAVIGGGDPAHDIVAHVGMVPVGVVGHLLDHNRVLDAYLLKRLVPLQNALTHRVAIFMRDGVIQPEHDGLLGRREGRVRVGFLQMPAQNVALRLIGHLVVHVQKLGGEVADTRVIVARAIAVIHRQLPEVVVDGYRETARVSQIRAAQQTTQQSSQTAPTRRAACEVIRRLHKQVVGEHLDLIVDGLLAVN
ncbi:hypothetical protein HRbin14_02012 [bacterium HR14]|nr:hypothetical protein HRbin14_02012 [bacterium HR14]